jgi:chromosome segregation ATPase
MAGEFKQPAEPDLDKTDRLPILQGTQFAADVADDAVPMDRTAVLPTTSFAPRPSGVDLPSLAQSVRSVEERITRQNSEYEALTRAHQRARDAEAASGQRAHALTAELAAARTALEAEQGRSRELERVSAERSSAAETARSRAEEALRESERYQTEARTLRESLAAREASIAQALHSLGERDAQLSALQQEHARVVPALEATSKSTSQLDADLQSARADANAHGAELKANRDKVAALSEQLKRSESEINATRYDLGAAKIQVSSYLDLLRTREWRRGFDENLFRDLDAQVGAAHADQSALATERARLQEQVATLETRLATQSAKARSERARLTAQLAARDRTLAQTPPSGGGDAEKVAELLRLAELKLEEQAAQIAQSQETQRPIQAVEADIRRLTAELAAKAVAFAEFEEQNRGLRATLERTRGALEEREFLIRRLERSETNNANVLGRIQTSIERLGSVPVLTDTAAATEERSAEFIRMDGENPITHVLSRRTRIGRATGCELQIDSNSVSRHHALVLVGPLETIIEDLNSTNGVLVNGRKVTRQALSDGDLLTFGETKFRYFVRPLRRPPAQNPAEPAAKA